MSAQSTWRPRRPGLFYRMMMTFIGLFDRWLHLSCRAFIQVASAKFDRPLTRGERVRQAIHRFMCRLCRHQEHHMDQLHVLSRRLGETAADDETFQLSDDARQRIERAVRRAQQETGGQEPPAP